MFYASRCLTKDARHQVISHFQFVFAQIAPASLGPGTNPRFTHTFADEDQMSLLKGRIAF